MKKIFAILIVFIVSSYAGKNVTIKVRDQLGIQKSIEDSAAMFIDEIRPFLKTPMNWCTVEPTGESSVFPTTKKNIYIVQITAEMSCNEGMAYRFFKNITDRYKEFILNNRVIIRSMIAKQYPDLEFTGQMMNHTFVVALRYNREHGGDISTNTIKFFKMVLNDNDKFTSPDMKMFSSLGYLITNGTPSPPSKVSEEFRFKIYKKTLEEDSFNIRFEPVYHPTLEDICLLKSTHL